jgi:urocanate hydratase
LHFVKDGHHRVSVAIATGQQTIDADVTEILTHRPATGITRHSDLMKIANNRKTPIQDGPW